MSKRSLPKLPADFFSLLGRLSIGPVTVTDPKVVEDMFGRYLPHLRHIEISGEMPPVSEWITLWHEVIHSVLGDTGVDNAITEIQAELFCDAVATYLTAMMLAGELTVHRKGSKTQT